MSPKNKESRINPQSTGRIIFNEDRLKKFGKEKSLIKEAQLLRISCQRTPKINAPSLTESKKVIRLNHVFVRMLPNRALARFARKSIARNSAAAGPVPGNIPANTPNPSPTAIFCGVSFILKSFW